MSKETKDQHPTDQESPYVFSRLQSNRFEKTYCVSSAVSYTYSSFDKMSSEIKKGIDFVEVDYSEYNHKFDYAKFNAQHVFSFGVKVESTSDFLDKVKKYAGNFEGGTEVVVIFNLRTS